MTTRLAAIAVAVGSIALAGCGSNSTPRPHSYGAMLQCFRTLGGDVRTAKVDLDVIAERAQKGAAKINFQDDSVTIVVEDSSGAARAAAKQYAPFASRFGGEVSQRGNAVVAWDKPPTGPHESSVNDCVDRS